MNIADHKFFQRFNFVCIEGVIGAGKTTLCRLIAEAFNARLILEQAEENPFLSRFYQDRQSFAFQTQLWFLVSRYHQLNQSSVQQDLFHRITIADYMFAKDRIFASINLDENEMGLYNTISGIMEKNVPRPDAVIYLQASTDVLLSRIEKRKRLFEFNMDPGYIDLLNQSYNHFFHHYTESPLLIINTSDIDFVNDPVDLSEIVDQILNIGHGTSFFSPLSSRSFVRKSSEPPGPPFNESGNG